MNRVDRLLAIILYLQTRQNATVEDLAEHFGLTERTMYRDLIALGEAGVPLVSEPKRGYAILKGYTLPPVNLTESEAFALSMSGLLIDQLMAEGVGQPIRAALEKIKSVLPEPTKIRFEKLRHAMAVTALPTEVAQISLSKLQQAIVDNQVITFGYAKPGTKLEQRIVEPMGLIHYLARWHLIAWCRTRSAHRDFRTDRMHNLSFTEEKFERKENFDARQFIKNSMPAPELVGVVKFDLVSMDRAKREWWLGIEGEEQSDNGFILKLKTVDWLMLARWLLSFSTSATVLGPDELMTLVQAESLSLSRHHSRSSPSTLIV